jgi:hypothetical protein
MVRGGENDFLERDALGGFGEFSECGGGRRIGRSQICVRQKRKGEDGNNFAGAKPILKYRV